MSQEQYRKMKSSKVHKHCFFSFWCQMSSVARALLGICVFLFEIRESQETSGLSWGSKNTTLADKAAETVASTSVAIANTILASNVITPEVLETNGIPQFHSPRLRLKVKEGDRVELPCKIHNLGDHHVIWRHGTNILVGTNVTTYSDKRIQLLPDLTLQISGVRRDDQGEYECILTGAFPRPGLKHSIIIQDAPTVTVMPSSQVVVMEGDNVEIGCIPHGNPLPRITWSMRDVRSPTLINPRMLHAETLKLEQVKPSQAGLYVCEADNGVGRPAIGAIYLRILHTPEVEIPKRRVHGGVGFKAELICIVHSDPPAEVKWRVGQEVVETSDRVYTEITNMNENSLIFNPVRNYDFKTYTCEANNSQGYVLRHIEFTGVPNPPVINSWETQILVKGTLNGNHTTEETLIKEEISVTLFWKVECKSSLIDYRLHFRPDVRNEITGFTEDRTPPWKELAIPADQSTASFLHTKTFTIRGLLPSTIYEAAIKARNKHGWSPISDICYFSTFPNSSSAKQQEFLESRQKWRELMQPDIKGPQLPSKEEIAGYKSSGERVSWIHSVCTMCSGVLLLSLIPVICKYSSLD